MRTKELRIAAFVLIISAASSCGSGEDDAAITPNKNRYLWWTRESMTGDNGPYYTANVVKGSQIYQSPYLSSNDGVVWSTAANDNLHRAFEYFGGYFLAESKNQTANALVSNIRVYTPLDGSSSITVDKSSNTTGISRVAWEGGSTVFAIANNSGGIYGGDAYQDYVLKSTNGGQTWAPITHQPSEHEDRLSLDGIWLIDGNLFVMEFINGPNGTRRKLHLASDAGESGFWAESSELLYPLSLHGVQGIGGIAIFAVDENGTYNIEIKATTFILHDVEFETGSNYAGRIVGLGSVNGGNNTQVFVNSYGLYVIDPVSKKFYNPSAEGEYSLPGVGGIVIFGDEAIVTAGSSVYRTAYPFVFHETPF